MILFVNFSMISDDEANKLDNKPNITELSEKIKDFNAETIDGSNFTLSEQSGKVVLLYFFSIYCSPCESKVLEMNELNNEYKDRGVVIVGISPNTEKDKVLEYVEKSNINWPVIYNENGQSDNIAGLYDVKYLPKIFIIDKYGNIRYNEIITVNKIREVIDRLLNE